MKQYIAPTIRVHQLSVEPLLIVSETLPYGTGNGQGGSTRESLSKEFDF